LGRYHKSKTGKIRHNFLSQRPIDFDKSESMLNQLIRKRQGKIIRLADSSRLTSDLSSKLTFEEREFYNNLHNISNDFKNQLLGSKN